MYEALEKQEQKSNVLCIILFGILHIFNKKKSWIVINVQTLAHFHF